MDSLGGGLGLGDEREKVANVDDKSSALDLWVYCDIFNLGCSRKKNSGM